MTEPILRRMRSRSTRYRRGHKRRSRSITSLRHPRFPERYLDTRVVEGCSAGTRRSLWNTDVRPSLSRPPRSRVPPRCRGMSLLCADHTLRLRSPRGFERDPGRDPEAALSGAAASTLCCAYSAGADLADSLPQLHPPSYRRGFWRTSVALRSHERLDRWLHAARAQRRVLAAFVNGRRSFAAVEGGRTLLSFARQLAHSSSGCAFAGWLCPHSLRRGAEIDGGVRRSRCAAHGSAWRRVLEARPTPVPDGSARIRRDVARCADLDASINPSRSRT